MGAIDKTAEEQVKDTFVVVPLSLHVKPRAANRRKIDHIRILSIGLELACNKG